MAPLFPRNALPQALNILFGATTQQARRDAAAEIKALLETYVEQEPLPAAPDTQAAAAATRKALGKRLCALDTMSDADLEKFNALLPWSAVTADSRGRTVGQAFSPDKRNRVSGVIDRRQRDFERVFSFRKRHVLEVGCFEGIHTVGLLLLGAKVTAADARIENVLKTLARVWIYGRRCDVLAWNMEDAAPPLLPERWDVLHHIGVLYHLSNPVEHLLEVLPRTGSAVLLDTHVAGPQDVLQEYAVAGKIYRHRRKPEPNIAVSPFAGMTDHAKYLLLDDLMGLLRDQGFADTRLISDRDERNGRRVTIWAFREPPLSS